MLKIIRQKRTHTTGANVFSDFVVKIGHKSLKLNPKVPNIVNFKEKRAAGSLFWIFCV